MPSAVCSVGADPDAVVATATHNALRNHAAASRDERPRLAGLELRHRARTATAARVGVEAPTLPAAAAP